MDLQGQTKCTMTHVQPARAGRFFGPEGCRRKFLKFFPSGFRDETYVSWEREYKFTAHQRWDDELNAPRMRALMKDRDYAELARKAVTIESRTNLLFSFEKMALRDAVRTPDGARIFSEGLYDFLHGRSSDETRFQRWVEAVGSLPRRQTRVLTWPLLTVFGFIAQPDRHVFLKPNVTRRAANMYGFEFVYRSKPNWETYSCLLAFAEQVRKDQRALRPRDMIDLQSFIWVQGSDEYE
jgi:hypothetical protein